MQNQDKTYIHTLSSSVEENKINIFFISLCTYRENRVRGMQRSFFVGYCGWSQIKKVCYFSARCRYEHTRTYTICIRLEITNNTQRRQRTAEKVGFLQVVEKLGGERERVSGMPWKRRREALIKLYEHNTRWQMKE